MGWVRVVVTRIEHDGTMHRRMVDTVEQSDPRNWEDLTARALAAPPPYRAVPGTDVYHICGRLHGPSRRVQAGGSAARPGHRGAGGRKRDVTHDCVQCPRLAHYHPGLRLASDAWFPRHPR
jgi:hypothetical protein